MGLPITEQRTPLLPNVVPQSRLHPPRLNVFEAANNLFLPRGFRIFVDGIIQTLDQTASQIRTFLVG